MAFVNISNHPSSRWGAEQLSAAQNFGDVVDISFPEVPADPAADLHKLADLVVSQLPIEPCTVMVQGEMTLTFLLVRVLTSLGHCCVAAVTERKSVEVTAPNGAVTKTAVFVFAGFRNYPV